MNMAYWGSNGLKVWLKKDGKNLGNGFDGLTVNDDWFAPSQDEVNLVWHDVTIEGDATKDEVTLKISDSKNDRYANPIQIGTGFVNIDELGFYAGKNVPGILFFDNVTCSVWKEGDIGTPGYVEVSNETFNAEPATFFGAWNRHNFDNETLKVYGANGGSTNDGYYQFSDENVNADGWSLTVDVAMNAAKGGGIYFKDGGTDVLYLDNNGKLNQNTEGTFDNLPVNNGIGEGNPLKWSTVTLTGNRNLDQITYAAKSKDGTVDIPATKVAAYNVINRIGFWAEVGSELYIDNAKYKIADGATVTVNVTPALKATYSSVLPLDFSNIDGLDAYAANDYTNGTLTMKKVAAVPALSGLYVKAAEGTYTDGTYNVPVTAATSAPEVNLLKAQLTTGKVAQTDGDKTNFFLTKDGFAPAAAKNKLEAGKAYLQLPTANVTSAGAKVMMVFNNEATAIDVLDSSKTKVQNSKVYDLQGRLVNGQLQRGIYIRGGKKFVVK